MLYKRTTNRDIPNIGIITNNKLVELQNQFQEAGISIYSQESIVGEAIIYDLVEMTKKGGIDFLTYLNTVEQIDEKKNGQINSLEKVTPVRKIFAGIRKIFKPKQLEVIPYTDEEQEEIDACLSKYIDTANQVLQYNLSDNLVVPILKKFLRENYEVNNILELLEGTIIPDLQKLGLSDKIEEFKQTLVKAYQSSEEISKDSGIKLEESKIIEQTVDASDKQIEIQHIQSESKQQTEYKKDIDDSDICLE